MQSQPEGSPKPMERQLVDWNRKATLASDPFAAAPRPAANSLLDLAPLTEWLAKLQETAGSVRFRLLGTVEMDLEKESSVEDPEGYPIVLDLVGGRELVQLAAAIRQADLGPALEAALKEFRPLLARIRRDVAARHGIGLVDDDEAPWWWLTFNQPSLGSSDGLLYLDPASGGSEPGQLQSAERAPAQVQAILNELATLRHIEDASVEVISELLSRVAGPRELPRLVGAVIDVGQANCNELAIVSDANRSRPTSWPRMYFDFGWPLGFHLSSLPPTRTKFCFSHSPPVVLSHWDQDHWGAARMPGGAWRPGATEQTWVAPRQWLGPNHLALASQLHKGGNLLLWPSSCSGLQFPAGEIVRCTGPNSLLKSQRNDTGLALYRTDAPGSAKSPAILFPGDADYPHIPNPSGYELVGLVATHHGGGCTAIPKATGNAKIVFSVGDPNRYGHQVSGTNAAYCGAGWKVQHRTCSRHDGCPDCPDVSIGHKVISLAPVALPLCRACWASTEACTTCLVA